MKTISEIFVLIGVPLTLVVSILGIIYSRKNIRTSKYIETITTERLKWLEIIRNEVTDLISNIYFTLKIYSKKVEDIQFDANPDRVINSSIQDTNIFDAKTDIAFADRPNAWSETDFIKKLNIFKLRLNPKEDIEIIKIADYFIKFYAVSEFKSEGELIEAQKKVDLLVEKVQVLLKTEWEKCKYETNRK
jgi:hypothetical protein